MLIIELSPLKKINKILVYILFYLIKSINSPILIDQIINLKFNKIYELIKQKFFFTASVPFLIPYKNIL